MRRIIALLLTVVMALSLVVVAGAAETGKTVNLRIVPAMTDEEAKDKTELTYYVFLEPQGDAEVGAAQFTLTAPAGTTFKSVEFNTEYVYDGSGNSVVGSDKGIFAKSAITIDPDSGDFGGQLKDNGSTFVAILAGTNREERMLTANTSKEKEYTKAWLYEVTLEVLPAFDGKTNYTIGVKDATAGYNGDSKETGRVDDVTMKHTVNVSSTGYGGMLGDINGDTVIDVKDVLLLRQIAVGNITPTAAQKAAGDIVVDGDIDVKDVLLLRQAAVGNIKLN